MRTFLFPYSSFVIACLIVVLAFTTATTYTQLTVAILLYFLLAYVAFKVFPRKTRMYHSGKPVTAMQSRVKVEAAERGNVGIADIDKRVFLKLIGGVGLSLFLFSLFNKKVGGLFSKNIPASGSVSLQDATGNTIHPAQNQPTDGYRISEIDDNAIAFYGFINKDGAWFIMKEDSDTGTFRYSRGDANFSDNWANREKLQYDYFSKIFAGSKAGF